MQTYRSKIDIWLIAVILAAIFLPVILAWGEPAILIIAATTAVPTALLTSWLFWATRYVVSDNALTIHSGFGKKTIPFEAIKSVTPSRSLLASPAMSLDRLEIRYGQNQSILISPKDKAGFLAAIGQD